MRYRIIITALLVFISFLMLGAKVTYLQVYKGNFLRAVFNKQFVRIEEIEPKRCRISDRNGKILALSMLTDSFFCIPSEVDDKLKVAELSSKYLNFDKQKIIDNIDSKKGFFWIKRKVPVSVSTEINSKPLPKGLGSLKEAKRYYPKGQMACHVLGVTGLDNRGLGGVEYLLDSYLKGKVIKFSTGKDALGRQIVTNETFEQEDAPSFEVALTIDEVIQYNAEKYAEQLYRKSRSKAVTIIVQKTDTGEILALVNRPAFDGNDIGRDDVSILTNDAVTKVYEPGSTLKVFVAAAVLEEGKAELDTVIFCENGKYNIGNYTIKDHEKYGKLSLKDVITYSSNIGMAKIGEALGKEKLYSYLLSFGFGNYTGIRLPGESKGILRHPNDWSSVSPSVIAFGQEMGVTSIQMISAYSCIANKGILLEPQIIKSIKNNKGKDISSLKKRSVRRVISVKTSEEIIESMQAVVKKGTATSAELEGYNIAGKTGTAQKIDPETRSYYENKYIASFIGFFPADKPEISILVLADEPQGIYWGGEVCAPYFKKLAKDIAVYLHIPKMNKSSE